MTFLSRTLYTPPPYSVMEHALMRGTTQSMYETSVTNLHALKGMEVSAITYASDGLKITGIEVVPNDLAAGEKIPLMIYNRGGSGNYGMLSPGQVTVLMAPFVQRMRLGVLASNYRGKGGSEGSEQWGGADVLNLMALGKQQDWWDGVNIFMLGWSRGGMMTYLALKAGAQVNAAAIGAGVTDVAAGNKIRPEMERVMERFIPNYPAGREELLRERSALFWPEKLNVPLLILHGDADDTVHVSEARHLVEKLQALGKEVKYVEYPEGDHALKKHWKQWVDETVTWFEKYKR